MNPQQLLNAIQQKNRELTAKNDEYKQLQIAFAEAEYAYNVAYATKILELKADGEAVTTQKVLALGDKAVAKLKLDMEIARTMVKTCAKSMSVIETGIDSARSTLSWFKAELNSGG